MQSIEEIIRLREEAIQELLKEKGQLESELETLTTRLGEITKQLQRLGYRATEVAQSLGPLTDKKGEHAIEQHLDGKRPPIVDLFHSVSENILELDEEVHERPRKHYIAYCTTKNFCEIVVQASKLWVYVDIAHSELHDPKNIAEDCSSIGHWATGDTRFEIRSQDEVEYAMSLISQAYERGR